LSGNIVVVAEMVKAAVEVVGGSAEISQANKRSGGGVQGLLIAVWGKAARAPEGGQTAHIRRRSASVEIE
jgi:hypothetical protein